jgi:capsid protein
MTWLKTLRRKMFGATPLYDAAGSARRSLAWSPANPGAVAALSLAQDTLRAKSRDLVRRNAWAATLRIESYVANAIGTGIKPQIDAGTTAAQREAVRTPCGATGPWKMPMQPV